MKFRINAFERFIIRNHVALRRIIYVVGMLIILMLLPLGISLSLWQILLLAIALAIPIVLIDLTAVFKFNRISKIAEVELDLQAAVDACDRMLAILKPKQLEYVGSVSVLKATALFDMGERDESKKTVCGFLDTCDTKKLPYIQMAQCHALMAIAALNERDFKEYEFQRGRMQRNIDSGSKAERITFEKSGVAHALDLYHRLFASDEYDEALEKEALLLPERKNSKPIPEKNRTPLSYISAYSMLFEYCKRLNLTEKTHYYARKVSRLANEQFECWREAKEYLDNEDIAD